MVMVRTAACHVLLLMHEADITSPRHADTNRHASRIPGAAVCNALLCAFVPRSALTAHPMPTQGWLRSKSIEVIEFGELTPKEARTASMLGLLEC